MTKKTNIQRTSMYLGIKSCYTIGKKKMKAAVMLFSIMMVFILPQQCFADLYDITYEPYNIIDEWIGNNPSICKIDDTHYLVQANQPGFVFSQIRVVTVDPETGAMISGSDVMLAPGAMEVTILPIDYTHYFCAYRTISDFGAAVVTVDTASWTVTVESDFLIDPPNAAMYINASKINENHFLVAFQSHSTPEDSKLWGVVLNVNTSNWVISGGDYYMIIDGNSTAFNRLISIDDTHHLCVSNSFDGDANCLATVLTVDPDNLTVTSEATYDLEIDDVIMMDLAKYDDTHFILDYSVAVGQDYAAYAVVLSVDPDDWSVTKEIPLQIDALGLDPDLSRVDDTHYLCSYISVDASYTHSIGKGVVLTLNPADWTFTMETPNDQILGDRVGNPMMSKIDNAHYIVVYCLYDPDYMKYSGVAQVLKVEIGLYANATATPPEICLGNSTQLESNAGWISGDVTYSWTPAETLSDPGIENPIATPDETTEYTVTVTDEVNTVTSCVTVVVHTQPDMPVITVNGATTFCEGGNVILIAPDGYNVYIWSNSETSQSITVEEPGDYTVIVGNSQYCLSDPSNPVTVTVNPVPETPVITQFDNLLASNAEDGNQWYNSNGAIADATGQVYYPTATDNYYVIVTNEYGCESEQSNVIYFIYTGIGEFIKDQQINVYPNPFKHSATFNLSITSNLQVSLKIYDATGRLVSTLLDKTLRAGEHKIKFDASGQEPGIYYYTLKTPKQTIIRKLILME